MENNHAIEQLIQTARTKAAGKDIAIHLWQPLASELDSIIGENGFNSLFKRSFYLTCLTHPWVALNAPNPLQFRFIDLQAYRGEQNVSEADEANCMLLLTFTNILARLIGEPLTLTILHSAWGDIAPDISSEELQNE